MKSGMEIMCMPVSMCNSVSINYPSSFEILYIHTCRYLMQPLITRLMLKTQCRMRTASPGIWYARQSLNPRGSVLPWIPRSSPPSPAVPWSVGMTRPHLLQWADQPATAPVQPRSSEPVHKIDIISTLRITKKLIYNSDLPSDGYFESSCKINSTYICFLA